MASGRTRSAEGLLRTLWSAGAIGDADDPSLIARFLAGRDEGSESAFRVLVERHGPMVARVCRQVLGDGHDAQDAAQAVFLVLARKAGSVRSNSSVAPWLHGVACRVAARARRKSSTRRAGEARAVEYRTSHRVASTDLDPSALPDWDALHEEVHRLPGKYRDPVVLCYLAGQTYEEAARRLGCPVGTIRVRLSRARDRLRDRLTRRGFGPTAVAAWYHDALPAPPAGVSAGWTEATVRAASGFISGQTLAVGVVSASVLALGREGVMAMFVEKLKVVALCGLAAGTLGTGALIYAGQEPKGGGGSKTSAAPVAQVLDKRVADEVEKEIQARNAKLAIDRLVAAAKTRLEAQRAFYEEGRITIDRFLDASRQLMMAETEASRRPEDRVAAARSNRDRIKTVVEREKKELEVGRGTVADVSECQLALERAEHDLIQAAEDTDSVRALRARVDQLEKHLDRVIKFLDRQGYDKR